MQKTLIDNEVYFHLNEEWYTAQDHPVALLRAGQKIKNTWLQEKIRHIKPHLKNTQDLSSLCMLDVACGAGFLSNSLASELGSITGVDQSEQCLKIAREYDATKKVKYIKADAYHLPFPDETFDIVAAMDFLEHVDEPERVIAEISRVCKKGGLFFFHTFNRNFLSNLVVIKLLELIFKEKARHMHVKELFIKPQELQAMCTKNQLALRELVGMRPKFNLALLFSLLKQKVLPNFSFKLVKSLRISYLGVAEKI